MKNRESERDTARKTGIKEKQTSSKKIQYQFIP